MQLASNPEGATTRGQGDPPSTPRRTMSDVPLSREPMRCTAKSSRTGEPCKKWAIQGSNVCDTHGGRAPQVKRKAMERIMDAADDVAGELARLALNAESESVRVAAIKDLLDRAGYGAKQKIESEVTVHGQDDFARAVAELEAELDRRGPSGSPVAEDPPPAPDRT